MISIIFSGSPVFEQVANSVKKAFNPYFNPSEFIIQSSLRIFPGNAIIAKVESAKSEAFASCSGKKDHPPDKKRGDMSILRDIRKELFYAL